MKQPQTRAFRSFKEAVVSYIEAAFVDLDEGTCLQPALLIAHRFPEEEGATEFYGLEPSVFGDDGARSALVDDVIPRAIDEDNGHAIAILRHADVCDYLLDPSLPCSRKSDHHEHFEAIFCQVFDADTTVDIFYQVHREGGVVTIDDPIERPTDRDDPFALASHQAIVTNAARWN
jgi:hypothetical protein